MQTNSTDGLAKSAGRETDTERRFFFWGGVERHTKRQTGWEDRNRLRNNVRGGWKRIWKCRQRGGNKIEEGDQKKPEEWVILLLKSLENHKKQNVHII